MQLDINQSLDQSQFLDKEQDDQLSWQDQLAIALTSAPISNELEIFNKIEDLNWAWIYEYKPGKWQQFECLNCMIIESKWQLAKWNSSITFKIMIFKVICSINFKKMVAECKKDDGTYKHISIKRTMSNTRQRPNPEQRYQVNQGLSDLQDKLQLVNQKDLEWLAWNWRIIFK